MNKRTARIILRVRKKLSEANVLLDKEIDRLQDKDIELDLRDDLGHVWSCVDDAIETGFDHHMSDCEFVLKKYKK